MKRAGNLYDKICSFSNIIQSIHKAAKGNKKYRKKIATFILNSEKEALQLQKELLTQTYIPLPYSQFTIYDPKIRIISVAQFRDRVVFHALCNYAGTILDNSLISDSYACRKNKGMHRALKKANQFIKKSSYFLKLDIEKFFETISHKKLYELIQCKIKDKKTLWLIQQIIKKVPQNYSNGFGLPIGNLTSQYFANFYLSSLDHYIKQELKIKAYTRYMDDMLLLGRDKIILVSAFQEIEAFLRERLDLRLNEKATKLGRVTQGIPFLGFRICPHKIFILQKNWKRFKKKFIKQQNKYLQGKITQQALIQSISSMTEYICHADTSNLRKNFIDRFSIEI